MAKYCGIIGFVDFKEASLGVMRETPFIERRYKGDILRNSTRWENGDAKNDDLQINNQISIIADPYAYEHFFAMKYISWMGSLWKIKSVEVRKPRLILTIGGVYNGETLRT